MGATQPRRSSTAPPIAPAARAQPIVARPALPALRYWRASSISPRRRGRAAAHACPHCSHCAAAVSRAGNKSCQKTLQANCMARERRIIRLRSVRTAAHRRPIAARRFPRSNRPSPRSRPITPPHESAERLLAETDGAIARITLLQAASMPDQPAQRADPARSAGPSRCRSQRRKGAPSRSSR